MKGGTITFSGRFTTLPCVVRNISDNGARIQAQNTADVPDTFVLIVEMDGIEVDCQVVWRNEKFAGVKFTSEIKYTNPKRVQIVSATGVEKKVSLRKKSSCDESQRGLDIVEDAPPIQARSFEPTLVSKAHNFQIFIAEDDPDDRLLIKDAFDESGHNVTPRFFNNGKELLDFLTTDDAYIRGSNPGIILLDLNMPVMDGRATLRELKSRPETKKIPVVVLTTSNTEEDIETTLECGVSLYLNKPSSFDGLKEIIDTLKVYWVGNAQIPDRRK